MIKVKILNPTFDRNIPTFAPLLRVKDMLKDYSIDLTNSDDYDFIFEVNNREYIEGYFPGEIVSMIPRSFTKVKSGKIVVKRW